jgi:thiamine transport system permease protein
MDRNRITLNIPWHRITPQRANLLLWGGPLIFLVVFYLYPLGSILQLSFVRSEAGFLAPFIEIFNSPAERHVVGFTIWQATLSTLLTLGVGLPGAYLMAHYQFPGKSLLRALTGVPFVLPTLVAATAFDSLLGPRGWVNLGLMSLFNKDSPIINFNYTLAAILIVHVFYNTTIVLRIVGDFWSHLNPRLGEAARTLGAGAWQVMRHITLPLLAPAITAAALLVFIFDFTSFGVILVLGGAHFATMEVEIFYQTTGLFNLPLAAALSILQLIFTLTLTMLYTRLSAGLSRPLTLRSQDYTQRPLNTWRSRLLAISIAGFLLVLLVLPLSSLALRSVTRLEGDRGQTSQVQRGLTLEFYRQLAVNRRQSLFFVPPTTAIAISLGYAASTVVFALALGIPAAWSLSRNRHSSLNSNGTGMAINHLLDSLIMLPIGTSAVTLGLGFIIALSRPPLDLRASILLIPLAHTLVAFPFVVRSLTPALRSIQPRLRQAASVLGASPSQVIRYVDFPLVGRALLVAASFAFTISLGEFGATSLLARPEYPTVPVAIYRFISRPGGLNYGQALALSTILMGVCLAGMLAIERFRILGAGEF